MKKITLCYLGVAFAIYSIASAPQLAAQSVSFQDVIAFSTDQGRLCFFDRTSGKIYVYDGEGKACLFQGQLKELGQPFEAIQKTTSAPATARKIGPGAKVMINNRGEKTVILNASQGEL